MHNRTHSDVMQANTNLAGYFAPAIIEWDGAYGRAVRAVSIAVRKHLTYGFFTWQPVRSYLKTADDDSAEIES